MRAAEAAVWQLETSIWAPRCTWSDARHFWDTDETRDAQLDAVWRRALQMGVRKYVARQLLEARGDDDDELVETELQRMLVVLRSHRALLFGAFDFYASSGGSWDGTLSLNPYTQVRGGRAGARGRAGRTGGGALAC